MHDAEKLAVKIAEKANRLLQPMQTEMDANRWAPEFRAIMWQAIADTASRLAAEQK